MTSDNLSDEMKDEESSSGSSKHVIAFDENDPGNPYNWSTPRKLFIEAIGMLLILNSTVSSSLPSGAETQLQEHFNVQDETQLILPTSVYLIGYILGPIFFAPISESNGRRKVLLITFGLFCIFTLAICFAPNWPAFVVFRFLTGIFASPALSVTGGVFADIFADPVRRGRSIALFMTLASFGPTVAPTCSGYLGTVSWRWPFWFALALAGFVAIFVVWLPETFGPEILHKRAKKTRKADPESNAWAPIDLEKTSAMRTIQIYAGRPLRMLFTEPIVAFSCMFLSLIYAVEFILFQAYAYIYAPLYDFNQGEVGLAFLPISIGSLMAMPVYLLWERKLRNATKRGAPWTQSQEYKRLPLALLGGPFFTIGLFWIGWGAQKDVHWIVSMLGGLPLGMGFVLIFIALCNYMADAYGIYAASALGASSIARSIFGVVLPFATKAMFTTLGVSWACSLLGFFSLIMSFIPFVFIKFGPRIREKSPMCQELAKKQRSSVT